MVATASASNATKVTASTRPTVSGRRPGAHIPPAGSAAVAEVLAISMLTTVRVEPQPRLRSSGISPGRLGVAAACGRRPTRASLAWAGEGPARQLLDLMAATGA